MRRKRDWETAPPPDPTGPSTTAASNLALPLGSDDPEQLGRYRLLGRLGEGGMGTVYLGRSPDDRLVAVKVIRADLARVPEFRARFRREADVARRVARFCTAEVLDVVDPPDGQPYLVTEYVDGLTLAQAVAVEGPLRSADLERVAVSVAAALTAIHGAGLVHRDLKPSNVLLSTLGPRVIDFGIARALDAQTMLSQEIQRIGTPAFMAPEQANGLAVTAAADIFAWGGLVTYAGTGSYPFGDGPTPVQLYRVVHREPLLDGLDPALRPIVEQAMRKDPAQRPSAQELFLRLVGMGPATHPDPDVTRVIRTGSTPVITPATDPRAGSAAPPVDGAPAGAAPAGQSPGAALPGQAGGTPPPGRSGGTARGGQSTGASAGTGAGTGGTGPDTGGTGAGEAGHGARSLADVPAQPAPEHDQAADRRQPAPGGGPGPRATRFLAATSRRRIALFAAPVLALLLIAALIPLAFSTGAGKEETQADVARRVAATAEAVRDSDAGRAARLSLAAFRISPVPQARASLRTSYSAATATVLSGHTGSVLGLGISPDGRTVATSGADNVARLWDVSDRTRPRQLATIDAHGAWVLDAAFSPDGKLLATVGYDRSARLWDISDRTRPKQLSVMLAHNGYVLDAAFSPDGRMLATSGYDNTARLWDITDPRQPHELAVLNRHTSWVNEVAFSPDGKLLATASADHTARLWDIANPRQPRPLAAITAHTDFVWTVAFSPDGRRLATGGYDGLVKIWDVTDPTRPGATASFRADEKWVFDVAYSPDGRTLATAGWDTSVHLWDLTAPGQPAPAGRVSGHGDWVQAVEFTPDGTSIVTVSDDHTARISRIDDAGLVARACADPSRQITAAEWQRDITDVPYQPVC
ncbi:WD40 repeat domain-containing serine/threonine protein kinase [Parafrankia discariae]|uniref:WD40 repeat domain-containing serine/threonine protein kinase n=1 Tax=Parafrankia discariae TaxID=365528 RepID=UPI0003659511|nr:serine/threonine-protein kinase [Parafrankia discariae]